MNKNSTLLLLEAYSKLTTKRLWKEAIWLMKDVEIEPIKEIGEIETQHLKPKLKQCYLNALAVCITNPKVQYVEGYIEVHGVPIEHAWNCYKGKHFDITQEKLEQEEFSICSKRSDIPYPHRAIMIVNSTKAMKFALKSGVSGPYINKWLAECIIKTKRLMEAFDLHQSN
jgi:hypothetical protein